MSIIGKKTSIFISCFAVFGFALVVLMSCLFLNKQSSESLETQVTMGYHMLENEVSKVQTTISNLEEMLQTNDLLQQSFTENSIENILEQFRIIASQNGYMAVFTDIDRNVLYSTSDKITKIINFDKAAKGQEGYLSSDEFPMLYMKSSAITDANNEIIGYSFIAFDLTSDEFLDNLKTILGAEVTVFSGNTRVGTTVINNGERAIGTTMSDNVKAIVINKGEVYKGKAKILDKSHVCYYSPISDGNNTIGALFVGLSTAQTDKLLSFSIIFSVGISVIVCVVMIISLLLYLHKNIIKPVLEIKRLALDMEQGDLASSNKSDIVMPNNEIGELSNVLNNTRQTLSIYVQDISRMLQLMSSGDFSTTSIMSYRGDFLLIGNNLNKLCNNMKSTITKLNRIAQSVTTHSSEISNGTELVAEGTARQSASIEEILSTISVITEKVNLNAEAAQKADACGTRACECVDMQSTKMSELDIAMEDIRDKSQEINKIVQTIEDIAFQTNILALNAAIEAARAGDAGKGFSVVADEVRALALKSDEASKKTTQIIEETLSSIDTGSNIVDVTKKNLKEVKSAAEQTNSLIEAIAQECAEQAEAFQQVQLGIEQVSQVIQQNSATAEESAAGCTELYSQSKDLFNEIKQFKI